MISANNRGAALLVASLLPLGALLVTAALASPQKSHKKSPAGKHAGRTAGGLAAQGKKVFAANGCARCHAIGGQGGSIGPDLSSEGTKRSRSWISAQIVNPKAHKADSAMPAFGGKIKGKALTALVAYVASSKK